jgi:hypothetical protein
MKGKIVGVVLIVLMFAVGIVYAAPVDTSVLSQDKNGIIWENQSGEGLLSSMVLSVAGEASYLPERELDKVEAEASADFFGAKFILSLLDKYNLYATVGSINDPKVSAVLANTAGVVSEVLFKLDNDTILGVGLSGLIYELKDSGIKLFADAAYRGSNDLTIETMRIDGKEYSGTSLIDQDAAEWSEWQAALGISKDIGILTPYVGVKYSDVNIYTSAAYNGANTWTIDDAGSDNVVGVFAGLSLLPCDGKVKLDVQGSFVDETSVSGSVSVKF